MNEYQQTVDSWQDWEDRKPGVVWLKKRDDEVRFGTVEPPKTQTRNKRRVYTFSQKTRKDLYKPGNTIPGVKARNELMDSPEALDLMRKTIHAARMALKMNPVRSNQELIERIDQYFTMAEGREIPPTVEEFSLYIGYDTAMLSDWQSGVRAGFPDVPYPGATTSSILKKAIQLLHAVDAVQVSKGQLNSVAYIFRSKNYYGMKDSQEAIIKVQSVVPEALSAAEIAKMLPEITIVDDARDVTDDYDII